MRDADCPCAPTLETVTAAASQLATTMATIELIPINDIVRLGEGWVCKGREHRQNDWSKWGKSEPHLKKQHSPITTKKTKQIQLAKKLHFLDLFLAGCFLSPSAVLDLTFLTARRLAAVFSAILLLRWAPGMVLWHWKVLPIWTGTHCLHWSCKVHPFKSVIPSSSSTLSSLLRSLWGAQAVQSRFFYMFCRSATVLL